MDLIENLVLYLKVPLPKARTKVDLQSLENSANYKKRLQTFRAESLLPQVFVEEYDKLLRLHMLFIETNLFQSRFGANNGKIIEARLFTINEPRLIFFSTRTNDFLEQGSC